MVSHAQPRTAPVPRSADPALTAVASLPTRDRALTRDLLDVLAHHTALYDHALSVLVRGGVAHVSGPVASTAERDLIRRVVARVRGIEAVWDVLRVGGDGALRVVDLGCGRQKQHAWAIGVDAYPYDGVDIVADIERGLPFGDHEVDQVYAIHFLEHLRDLLSVMNEIHRVLVPGGVLHVIVPNGQFVNAYADPTHVRYFNVQTFKYFCVPHPGLRPFRPLSASTAVDNIYADLQPVQDGEAGPDEEEIARHFG